MMMHALRQGQSLMSTFLVMGIIALIVALIVGPFVIKTSSKTTASTGEGTNAIVALWDKTIGKLLSNEPTDQEIALLQTRRSLLDAYRLCSDIGYTSCNCPFDTSGLTDEYYLTLKSLEQQLTAVLPFKKTGEEIPLFLQEVKALDVPLCIYSPEYPHIIAPDEVHLIREQTYVYPGVPDPVTREQTPFFSSGVLARMNNGQEAHLFPYVYALGDADGYADGRTVCLVKQSGVKQHPLYDDSCINLSSDFCRATSLHLLRAQQGTAEFEAPPFDRIGTLYVQRGDTIRLVVQLEGDSCDNAKVVLRESYDQQRSFISTAAENVAIFDIPALQPVQYKLPETPEELGSFIASGNYPVDDTPPPTPSLFFVVSVDDGKRTWIAPGGDHLPAVSLEFFITSDLSSLPYVSHEPTT